MSLQEKLLTAIEKIHLQNIREVSMQPPFYGDSDSLYKRIFADIKRQTGTISQIEDGHYGSGYASFIDAWFYQENDSFNFSVDKKGTHRSSGLTVIFNRLIPFYIMFEGEKYWNKQLGNGGWYMPYLHCVDDLKTQAVIDLAEKVDKILQNYQLTRLSKSDLQTELGSRTTWKIPTELNDNSRYYTYFDGLFFWQD